MIFAIPDDGGPDSARDPLVWRLGHDPDASELERIAVVVHDLAPRLQRPILVIWGGEAVWNLSGAPLGRLGRWLVRRAARRVRA